MSQIDFNNLLDRVEAAGIPFEAERTEAWTAFAGWRINYDQAVTGLGGRIGKVASHWHLNRKATA